MHVFIRICDLLCLLVLILSGTDWICSILIRSVLFCRLSSAHLSGFIGFPSLSGSAGPEGPARS